MPTLASELRNKLERVVVEARDVAEAGARAALEALAVHEAKYYPHMSKEKQELRNHLRARARQLGDRKSPKPKKGGQDHAIDHLVGECAYEHWHRMLFARFLAENGLLIEPGMNVAISLEEAEELAKEEGEDVWVFVSRCAERMLPQIFRPDDPLLQVSLATEHMVELERLLASLPAAVFSASDALGWVYQFWQTKKKKEVNDSEVKIGADEISAVTQLFTEPYMVEFLLHNTLGAWWAGKHLTAEDAENAETEEELRKKLALPGVDWAYLRFVREDAGSSNPQSAIRNPQSNWRPAAGTFDGWPKTAAELKVLDPCCGSGHFLVAALHHLVPIRMAEEGLSAAEAVDAVLRDNLHGLEIDERCCQIAAFALAFAAWTYPDAGGYRELPVLHVACTGIGPQCSAEQWIKLAEESGIPTSRLGREPIKNGLLNLHQLFSQAPTLGSLINPAELSADLITADYETIQPYLTAILKAEKADDETRERAIAAAGMVKAADLLAGEYTLIITNVPYLTRVKQTDVLMNFCLEHYKLSRADLATTFLDRILSLITTGGAVGVVTPQNWLFLHRYGDFREYALDKKTWRLLVQLGPGAFETISGEVVKPILLVLEGTPPAENGVTCLRRFEDRKLPREKARACQSETLDLLRQADQKKNPDHRVTFTPPTDVDLLTVLANGWQGIAPSDTPRFVRCWWELGAIENGWVLQQSRPKKTCLYGGRELVLFWEDGNGRITEVCQDGATFRGDRAWAHDGVSVSQIGLACTLYAGQKFDGNAHALVTFDPKHLPAVWCFCCSDEYRREIARIDRKLSVTNSNMTKVPFDLAHWQKVAAKKYPDGLPEPESDDPTQWLFHGHPYEADEEEMFQVAVARLLGYRWPAELDKEMRLSERARELVAECEELLEFADNDGIVCIPSVRGEEPASERLFGLLAACDIEPEVDLDDWLRNEFFEEHCQMFHHRPFVWHVWDGRKRDGFHALVNYHKLCEGGGKGRKVMESLTYSYLGDWITRQKDEVKRGEGGAEDRLAAALELQKRLEAILQGEPPFDIFVRWRPLHEQPIGWDPDINDGVRMNIRPFLAGDLLNGRKGAGILRWKPNIKWKKDRGKEPQRPKAEYPWFWGSDENTEDFVGGSKFDGNRWNDCHYTNKAKQVAREAADES